MRGTVRYYVTDTGEIRRVMPDGSVRYSDSTVEAFRDMRHFDRLGYEVLIDDEPLIPKTGLLGWLHKAIDRLQRRGK